MRGGLLVSEAPEFFDLVREALARGGATISDDGAYVQVDPDSQAPALLYAVDDAWQVPVLPASAEPTLDLTLMSATMVECRDGARVAALSLVVAESIDQPVWFLDATDAIWRADEINPDEVAL